MISGRHNRTPGIAVLMIAAAAVLTPAGLAQELGGCPMLPKSNIWNIAVDRMPVDPSSARLIEGTGIDKNLHPDWSEVGGVPINIVPRDQPMVDIEFIEGKAESDPGPYPIPPNPAVEIGEDAHVIILQQGTCKLYEIYSATKLANSSWKGYCGAVFDLRSNALRPDGWTSADAAGLPIAPGLVRYDEILAGEIKHAIRMTVPKTRRLYVWPGRHFASRTDDPNHPAMGQRFRLKANYDISGFAPEVQVVLRALKKYGMILADNGSAWYITGAPDPRWDDDAFHAMHNILGSAFEAVDVSSLMISEDSAAARPPQ